MVRPCDGQQVNQVLTLFRMTSYAEMRSVATKSNVLSSISKISRTLPDAIFLMLYWLRSTLVTAALEAMICDLSSCVCCVCYKMLSCVACWWVVRLGLANDWSLDLSSCEVGEFASLSLAGSLQSASQHSMLHVSTLHALVEPNHPVNGIWTHKTKDLVRVQIRPGRFVLKLETLRGFYIFFCAA